MNKFSLPIFILITFLFSCAKSNNAEVEIYSNNFDSGNLQGIIGGVISPFNGSNVLGNYNNEQFTLSISDLPEHDIVEIYFLLYIHDNWDGNTQAQDNLIGPDRWQMKVDNKTYINTTFSNGDCIPGNFCPPQSYPADYPNFYNNPKTGAASTDLPGFCSKATNTNGTTLYVIHKRLSHKDASITIQCLDQLVQKNVEDPKCDESWSIDNLQVNVIKLN